MIGKSTAKIIRRLFAMFGHLFLVSLWKRYGQKLRRIILLQFGLVTFRFVYGRDRKPIVSMISGFLDVSLSPNQYFLWRHQDTLENPRKANNLFNTIIVGNLKKLELEFLIVGEKAGAEKS